MHATRILFLSDEGPMLKTLDYTIRIGSTPTFLYFNNKQGCFACKLTHASLSCNAVSCQRHPTG